MERLVTSYFLGYNLKFKCCNFLVVCYHGVYRIGHWELMVFFFSLLCPYVPSLCHEHVGVQRHTFLCLSFYPLKTPLHPGRILFQTFRPRKVGERSMYVKSFNAGLGGGDVALLMWFPLVTGLELTTAATSLSSSKCRAPLKQV